MAMNNAQENDGPFYFFLWCVATHASWADLSEDLADTQPNSRAEEAWQVIWQPRVHSRHCLAGCWADMGAQLPWDLDRSPLSEAGEMEQALRLPQGPTPRSWCVCVRGKVVWHLSVTSWHREVSRFSGKLLPSLLPLPVRCPSLWKESSISESGVPDITATTQGGLRAWRTIPITSLSGRDSSLGGPRSSCPPFLLPPFLKGPHLSPWASEPPARLLFSH